MLQLPFKLKDSNQEYQNQYYTHYPTIIQTSSSDGLNIRTGEITKIEFLDDNENWVEPTEVIYKDDYYNANIYLYGYPYGYKHPHSGTGDDDNTWTNIVFSVKAFQGPSWGGAGLFNVQNTKRTGGIRLWSGNTLILTRRFYSESYFPDDQTYTSLGFNNRWADAYLRSKIKYFNR